MRWQHAALLTLCSSLVLGSDYLLPGDVRPTHYDLSFIFSVDPRENFSFFGVAKIDITATKPVSRVTFHGQGFDIARDKISVQGADNKTIPVSNILRNDIYSFVTIVLVGQLDKGQNYTLVIPFSGNLKEELEAVYISNYVDLKTNQTEYLIVSYLSARKGFPCFDEPIYKATFRLNIGHKKEFTAVANMPVYNTTQDSPLTDYWPWEEIETKIKSRDDIIWDQFENSVPMSTFLVSWMVSKFKYRESGRFRIWARADAFNQTDYASIIGPKILAHYESWFNMSFPLPKLDMVALPDFYAAAMEQWGLVTYREDALLYDKELSRFSSKEDIVGVISHELAHQWFGNLVTMKWWSDFWLSEGFATYMATVGMRSVEPDWRSQDTGAVFNMVSILSVDSLQSSHPVSVEMGYPERISEMFDEITNLKGATLIRMMVKILGEDVFRKAINIFLVKYSYSNADQDDLWLELNKVAKEYNVLSRKNVTVKEIMDTWTKQTGYPLLTVRRNYQANTLNITQKRYLALDGSAPTNVSWWLPLNVVCQQALGAPQREPLQWLGPHEGVDSAHQLEHGANDTQWVLFNADMFAQVRVNYDERNWELLSTTLNSDQFQTIPMLSRVQLLVDYFALAWTNVVDSKLALQLANYLQREVEFLPLQTGLAALFEIDVVLSRTSAYGVFQKYMRKLVTPMYKRAGGIHAKRIVNPDDLLAVKIQTLTSYWACYVKVPGCEENAIELFSRWMDSDNPDLDNPIPLDLRDTVMCTAISRGGVAHWMFLLARAQKANVIDARNSYLAAMACSRDVWILKQYLEWTVTTHSVVRPQDAGIVIGLIMRSKVGYYIARDFVQDRIDDLFKAFQGQGNPFGSIIQSMLGEISSQKELDQFLVWKQANEKYLEDVELAVQQAIENARVNIGWLERNKDYVVETMRELSE